ncbi:hypothetical protein BJX96DRAFT_118805 [Aspergillus floccosus]
MLAYIDEWTQRTGFACFLVASMSPTCDDNLQETGDQNPNSQSLGPKEKHGYQSFKYKQYADFAQTTFIAATIASTITLSRVLDPNSTVILQDDGLLAWASSLFIVSIMGSIFLIVCAKLEVYFFIIQIEALFVSLFIIVAFYLLLATATFRRQYPVPFIFGTVFYWLIVAMLLGLVAHLLKLHWGERATSRDSWELYWRRRMRSMKPSDHSEL